MLNLFVYSMLDQMGPRDWNKKFMTKFIKTYKSHPCLWKVGCVQYSDSKLRVKAYQQLVHLCKTIYKNANKRFVIQKIDFIRGCYQKEFEKVQKSKRITSKGYTYVSKLWYYDLLSFIKNEQTVVEMVEDLQVIDDNLSADENSKSDVVNVENTTWEVNEMFLHKKQNEFEAETNNSLNICTEIKKIDNEHTAFGIVIAAKLRSMDEVQKVYAEHLINQVLFNGQLEKLNEFTTINEADPSYTIVTLNSP